MLHIVVCICFTSFLVQKLSIQHDVETIAEQLSLNLDEENNVSKQKQDTNNKKSQQQVSSNTTCCTGSGRHSDYDNDNEEDNSQIRYYSIHHHERFKQSALINGHDMYQKMELKQLRYKHLHLPCQYSIHHCCH
jgi:hypothetical protein